MPEAELRSWLPDDTYVLALGVLPPSRDAAPFLAAVATGATLEQPGALLGGSVGAEVRVATSPRARDGALRALGDSLLARGARATSFEDLGRSTGSSAVISVATFVDHEDAAVFVSSSPCAEVPLVAIGVADEGPPAVAIARAGRTPGLLIGAETRRPGIVTPPDVSLSITTFMAAADPGLRSEAASDPLGALDELRARLERDAGVLRPVTLLTVSFGLGMLFFAIVSLALRRRRSAAAFARAAACVPAGYVVALLVPDGRWPVRATALVAAIVFGLSFGARDTRRFAGWVFVLTAASIVVLAILAAARPGGEPALSVWGNPLESGRYFGLRNHLAAFMTGGLVAGAALLMMPWWLLLACSAAVGVVLGAASVGANFLGVLTLTFGALVAIFALAAGRVRWLHVVPSAAVASVATVAALAADTAKTSHGGRAFETVRSGGWDAGFELFRGRAQLNYAEIADIGWAAYVALVGLTLVLVSLFAWTVRADHVARGVRAAVAGTAAAALAALVTEDSGFFTAGIVGLFAATSWLALRSDALSRPADAAHAPDAPPAPS